MTEEHVCKCKEKQNKLYEDLLKIVENRMIKDFKGYKRNFTCHKSLQ